MISEIVTDELALLKKLEEKILFYPHLSGGILQLKGNDRTRFLHNQTTNNLNGLKAGQNCQTVFVNSTGRTLDLVTAYLVEDAIWITVSPNRRQFLFNWMDRFIFPMDKVELGDLSEQYIKITLLGKASEIYLQKLGLTRSEANQHTEVLIHNIPCYLANGNDLGLPGYTLIVPVDHLTTIQTQLLNDGALAISDRLWEHLRITQGRPMPDQELTEDYNPLEAGLWKAISFEKGCYIGQETIARLNTYKGVKQRLWGIRLNQIAEVGTPIMLEGEKVGILTSFTDLETLFGLGYIRTKAGGEGLTVQVGEASGEVVSVPFLSHEYYQPTKA
ncbi:MAG: folate-binding protein [Snowella sp.]|nr:folate-binding protein [Snowella sp.]